MCVYLSIRVIKPVQLSSYIYIYYSAEQLILSHFYMRYLKQISYYVIGTQRIKGPQSIPTAMIDFSFI